MKRFSEMSAIMKKELRSYFNSPIAYIVISIFIGFTGFFFFIQFEFFAFNQAEMRTLFQLMPWMLSLAVPAITMKLFSEERHSGSFEILMTLPVSTFDIVLGKFLAGTFFSMIMISPTLIYLFTVVFLGTPDFGPIIGGYIGLFFLSAAYTSIGLLASSLTRNQIISLISACAAGFSLVFIPSKFGMVSYLGTEYHFQNIAKGLIDSKDIIYFISICALSLLFTMRVVEDRR